MKGIALALCVVLAACGGGGGGAEAQASESAPAKAADLVVVDGDSLAAAATWPDAFPGRLNLADSGSRVGDVLLRWDANVLPKSPFVTGRPAVYVLVVGTNDCRKGGERMEVVWYRLAAIWSKARSAGYKVIASTVHSVANPEPPVTDAQATACQQDLNARIRSRRDLYDALLDLEAALPDSDDPVNLTDGLHFSAAGSAAVAHEARRVLSALQQ